MRPRARRATPGDAHIVSWGLVSVCLHGAGVNLRRWAARRPVCGVVWGLFAFLFVGCGEQDKDDVQTTATSFGDNDTDALPTTSSGSEIDNITASYDSDELYIHVAGNMDTGFGGRLALFIDADGALTGENQLTDVADISFNRFQNMGESSPGAGDGMIFDAGFFPEHFVCAISGNTPDLYCDYAQILGPGSLGEYFGDPPGADEFAARMG